MRPLELRPATATASQTNPVASETLLDRTSDNDLAGEYNGGAVVDDRDSFDIALEQFRREGRERTARFEAKNRRKRYLEVHPEYFDDPALAVTQPLLYDRMIHRFKTTAEREAEGQRRGSASQFSADWLRRLTRQENLAKETSYSRGPNGEVLPEQEDEIPRSKAEGREWWVDAMTQRFLRGEDSEFDYARVDDNFDYDDPEEERDREEAYFDDMGPDYESDAGKCGETGIYDY
ncbi:coiled-coil domain-containing protein-domain-containing protein [Massariosphaeria phaeospora]|uniref:Coiled-coil domain-containing protein-domain-containing protein n=1 Tax=Massariosphaeria phaeospora TaxID=100035 RepID=A0A7C8I2A7_9PLEO|nr:coiled-coil domain-containing protein-domain-containing protein [Massariosphaeria phaeospora]